MKFASSGLSIPIFSKVKPFIDSLMKGFCCLLPGYFRNHCSKTLRMLQKIVTYVTRAKCISKTTHLQASVSNLCNSFVIYDSLVSQHTSCWKLGSSDNFEGPIVALTEVDGSQKLFRSWKKNELMRKNECDFRVQHPQITLKRYFPSKNLSSNLLSIISIEHVHFSCKTYPWMKENLYNYPPHQLGYQ